MHEPSNQFQSMTEGLTRFYFFSGVHRIGFLPPPIQDEATRNHLNNHGAFMDPLLLIIILLILFGGGGGWYYGGATVGGPIGLVLLIVLVVVLLRGRAPRV